MVLVLLFVALFFSTKRFVLCLTLCLSFVLVVFSPFSIVITSLGEERAYPDAFCTFVRFVLVWICQLPLPLGVWEGLRFVIVALPGLFSYQFFFFFFFYSTRRFVFLRLALCYFVLVIFSPFSIVITSLGQETANLSAFVQFVLFLVSSVSSFSSCLGWAAACDCGTP